MKTIHREILPRIGSVDATKGTVVFVSTNATLDCYSEVVNPKGADLSRSNKNAPLLDSHDSSSIKNLIGKVIDVRMNDGDLLMTAQFAIDVPENDTARQAFAMVKAGYLRACSIGFLPLKTLTRSDDGWSQAVEDLSIEDYADSVRCIYQKWQLLELSVCCIGANPEAVAKSGQLSGKQPKTLKEFFSPRK